MAMDIFAGTEWGFLLHLLAALAAGVIIGAEREWRGKDAGISTHSLVIGGSMLFTYLSMMMDPSSPARIAAQIVTGVGFLGAGIILKTKQGTVTNLTTAASIWFSAAIGMAIGFSWFVIAAMAVVYAILVPTIPRVKTHHSYK